ncbi:hypothetical protein [Mycobacterium sp.]|uniref:hypothetical protein n=1 Tax=Mycobacterium paragordonae TaxID=1389713 RepID=UPI001D425007|nr:hypothetical protein [Mycobacterium sp.]
MSDSVVDDGGVPALGAALELLHGADNAFSSVQATFRIWRHSEHAAAALRADLDKLRNAGAAISTMASRSSGEQVAAEQVEVMRIWREADRVREEHEGGPRDGSYAVRAGDLWWSWDPRMGARSNQDDPQVGSGVGEQVSLMLDPTSLLGALRFALAGLSTVAGRATLTVQAFPRWADSRRSQQMFMLHQLGSGADQYTLQVDRERGVVLDVVALVGGEAFHRITAMDIVFDRPIEEQQFRFEPPPGEEVQPIGQRMQPSRLTLAESQQRAPFTVLTLDRVPDNWRLDCLFIAPTPRPPQPAYVLVNYRSEDGHQAVSLSQCLAADQPSAYEQLFNSDVWRTVEHDGTMVRVTRSDVLGSQAQAHVERDGTLVILTSATFSSDQLAEIAACLKPAPTTNDIQ